MTGSRPPLRGGLTCSAAAARRIIRGLLTLAITACAATPSTTPGGKLSFKAHTPVARVTLGMNKLGLAVERDGFLFVPKGNSAKRKQPLLIMLHGATQRSRLFERLAPLADSLGVVLLAPESRDYTWDAIRGDFGPDIDFLDRAVMRAFDRAFVDPCRVVIGGFSDGASYALSLGIRNAKVLAGVVAFSPGFAIPAEDVGKLPVFMRHGTQDQILPIDRASRPLLEALKKAEFDVDYAEFEGPHTMRQSDARVAMQWVNKRSCAR